MFRRFHPASFAVLALLGALAVAPARAQVVPAERRLPKHVAVYLSIPDVRAFRARFSETYWGKLASDPALADFCASVRKQFDEATSELRQQLGVSWEDLWNLPAGQVALAVVNEPRQPVAMVVLVDIGQNRETLARLVEKINQNYDSQPGNRRQTEEFSGTTLHVYQRQVTRETPDGQTVRKLQTQGAYFVRDSVVAVGQNAQVLKSVLLRWDGRHEDTFAEAENFRYIRARAGGNGDPVLVWYLDLIGLVKSSLESSDEPNVGLAMAVGMLPTVGLANLKAVGGTVHLATPPYDSISRTLIVVDEPITGVLATLRFPAKDLAPPPWVPASVSGYTAFNWDVQGAYAAIRQLVDQFRGPGAFDRLIEQMADPDQGSGIHLKRDVLDLLNGEFRLVRFEERADAGGAPTGDVLLAAGVKDEAKMRAVLARMAERPGGGFGKAREFRGTTIYERAVAPGKNPMAIAVARGHLFFTNNVARIEQVLRGTSEAPLAESLDYRRLASHIPAETSIVFFSRQEQQLRILYDLLKKRGREVLPKLDFASLPDFDVIARYFPPSAGYAVPDKRGALIVTFTLAE